MANCGITDMVAEGLAWAATHGRLDALDALAQPPHSLGQADARADCGAALRLAAGNGHVSVIDRLGQAPWLLRHEDTRSLASYDAAMMEPVAPPSAALAFAVAGGHIDAARRLTEPPFACAPNGRSDTFEARLAQLVAAAYGHTALAETLFPSDTSDAYGPSLVLYHVVVSGDVRVLDLIVRGPHADTALAPFVETPPFPNAVSVLTNALEQAAARGHTDVLDLAAPLLAAHPEALPRPHFALACAATGGSVAVLDRLARPPYSLGHAEAFGVPVLDNYLLISAATRGHVAVMDRFALPPYSLAVSAHGLAAAMAAAAANGHVAAMDRLLLPPYSAYSAPDVTDDATTRKLMRAASREGHAAVIHRLTMPPFCVHEARAVVGCA